jgi:type IV pilus assembly protein PilA
MLSNIGKRFGRGFTLIELMIVVAIIGILAAIAIPNFVKFQCRSKQSEAKTNLKAMFVAQEAYRGEFDSYANIAATGQDNATLVNPAGWNPKGGKIRYVYSAIGEPTTFAGNALGTGDVQADQWTINQDNAMANPVNQCNQ